MKVTMLGTGSIYSKSNCAGILIDDNILVDIGPGVVKYLLRNNYDLSKIDTIILTHLHFDHIADLPLFLVDSKVTKIDHKINIYGPKGTEEKIINLNKLLNNRSIDRYIKDYINFIDIAKGTTFDIHNHILEVFDVLHGYIEAYAFIIDSKLGISGDSSLCENIKHLARNCEVMICDCSFEIGDDNHMGIDSVLVLKELNQQLKIIPTHYRDDAREKLRAMRLPHIHVVDDGYTTTV